MYSLLADRVEAWALAEFQTSVTLHAASQGKNAISDPNALRNEFDRWLREEPKPVTLEDAERQELLRALGLHGGRGS